MNLHEVFEIHMQKHGTECNALIGLKHNILRGRKEVPVRRNSCDAMKICMSTDVHVYLLIKRGQPEGQPPSHIVLAFLFHGDGLLHHFEKCGWKETQVVVRFWIITMLLCLVGLSTLKLR